MTLSDTGTYHAWAGHAVLDSTGHRVGKVSHIYVDDRTGQPEWLAVHTGFFKDRSAFVPLRGARAEGDRLVVAYERETIKHSPTFDEAGSLGPGDERELLGYYTGGEAGLAPSPGGPAGVDDALVQEVVVTETGMQDGRPTTREYVITEHAADPVAEQTDLDPPEPTPQLDGSPPKTR